MRYSETMRAPTLEHSYTSAPRAGAAQRHGKRRHRLAVFFGSMASVLLILAATAGGILVTHPQLFTQAEQITQNCILIVPDQPLTAKGLATPYQLSARGARTATCHETTGIQSAFVQGAILDPATGKISIYNPLVVDKGAASAIAPTVPTLPAGAIVALWFGFNGQALLLRGARGNTLQSANCVNGLNGSPFGQMAYCNASRFFQAANRLIRAGKMTPPALGMARDGQACPTVRDFAIVDQDQSDNVTTTYLITSDGQMAQNTAANMTALAGKSPHILANGSDNRLLSVAVDSALGCTPWSAPDLADAGALASALPLNELQAAAHQPAPVATVPSADPMVLRNGKPDLSKQNLYRIGVDQAPVTSMGQAAAQLRAYCQSLYRIGPARLLKDQPYLVSEPSLDSGVANNLFTFLAQRFVFTFGQQGLGCADRFQLQDPVTLHQDADGVTIDATISYP